MHGNRKLTDEQIADAKLQMWEGAAIWKIALSLGVTAALLSRIRQGLSHPTIPWPDGSIGPMPVGQREALATRDHIKGSLASLSIEEKAKLLQMVEEEAGKDDDAMLNEMKEV